MTHFIKKGNEFHVTHSANIDLRDSLPTGTYVVGFNPDKGGFYLDNVEPMKVPTKLYGDTPAHVERFVHTFQQRGKNTGILLSGEKGSGKTMLLCALSAKLAEQGIPTLVINDQYSGDAFNKFLESITQPCLVSFDEFEKTYDEENQNAILTLLDGVFNGHKLFVFTCNEVHKISRAIINRPGRVFYHVRYRGITDEAIRQYSEDNLGNKDNIESVVLAARTVDAFNFDMLKGLIEEMNRFNEAAPDALKLMNIRPEMSAYVNYTCRAHKTDDPEQTEVETSRTNYQNPLAQLASIMHPVIGKDSDGDNEYGVVMLNPKSLVKMDGEDIIMEGGGYTFVFKRVRHSEYEYF